MAVREGWRLYETPLGELRVYTHPCVYEPSDDTFLAIEALARLPEVKTDIRAAVDMGTGTGILALAITRIYPEAFIVATDINPHALQAANKTLQASKASVVACRWASCLRPRFDLAVVNPPYLPVEDQLDQCPELSKSWSGSPGILEEACREATRVAGAVVLVYSSLSQWSPHDCLREAGFEVVYGAGESFFMEKLYAVMAVRGSGAWTGYG
ncbi:MAG: methyltransferase [Desulfurococcales archaeon]|nr:methyltransferase [Desulfurococcales archaeon]